MLYRGSQVSPCLKGNPVKIRNGPAAVIGDEHYKYVTGHVFRLGRRNVSIDPRVRRPV